MNDPETIDNEDARAALEALEQVAPVGYWRADRHASSVACSPGVRRICGLPAAAAIGRSDLWALLGAAEKSDLEARLRRAESTRSAIVAELHLNITDTEPRRTRHLMQPRLGATGTITSWLGVMVDVADEPGTRVRNRRLDPALLRVKGIAHDLNNTLSAIVGGLEYARRTATDNEPVRDSLGSALTAAAHAASLVGALAEAVRSTVPEPESESFLCSPNDVVTDVSDMFRLAMRSDVRLEISLSDAVPHARIDRALLESCLLNLLVNAQEAISGTGRITVTSSHANDEAGPRRVCIDVTDTGGGVAAGLGSDIFAPFVTTKDDDGEHGLGLWRCKEIVERHAGTLSYETSSEGTTFHIRLPAYER